MIEEVTDKDVREDSITTGIEATESATEIMVCYSHAVFLIDGFSKITLEVRISVMVWVCRRKRRF